MSISSVFMIQIKSSEPLSYQKEFYSLKIEGTGILQTSDYPIKNVLPVCAYGQKSASVQENKCFM